ncbi:MAG TPA: FAD-dependent oxidoreductase, partial [Vicinamibacteria bacterium]|nr:FAD-dependent oxidoreductase [Vicinamibacteria bacterium]
MTQRAIVIGGGAIGVASAYYLQRSGFSVTIVDQGDVGRACSYGNSCLIVPSHSEPLPGPGVVGQALRFLLSSSSPFYVRPRLDPALARFFWRFRKHCNRGSAERGFEALVGLSRASLALYQELTSAKEADFYFRREGLLEVYLTERGVEIGRHARELMEREGFPAKLLSRDEAIAFEPALSSAIKGGLFIESEAHGFSFGYVQALARTVERAGGRIAAQRPVKGLLLDGRRVKGVRVGEAAGEEAIESDVVVLAAGSWSKRLGDGVGVSIPLQPAKGYSATVDAFDGAPRIPVLIKERRVTMTPLGDRVRFGGTLELTGFDSSIDRTRYGAVVKAARETLRAEIPMKNEEAWCGFRPLTPDGLPIIDRARNVDGLIVATGH